MRAALADGDKSVDSQFVERRRGSPPLVNTLSMFPNGRSSKCRAMLYSDISQRGLPSLLFLVYLSMRRHTAAHRECPTIGR